MEPKSIRSVLLLVVLALGVILGVVVVKRATRKAPAAPVASTAPATERPENHPVGDKALVRVQRAGAVTAIEKGDYASAIATLSGIVKGGNGLGDEVELLRVAKELEEKYREPSPKAVAAKPAAAPAPPPTPTPTPTASPAKPPPPKKPPARPVAKATAERPERAEPTTGLLLVTSVPTGLSVELDGKRADNTPLRRRLDVGPHEVIVRRSDGQTFRRLVTVEEDGIATVDADLGEPPPPPEPKPTPLEPAPKPTPPPPEDQRAVTPPPATGSPSAAAAHAPGLVGEVLVLQGGLVGDVYIGGVAYGPPPVLAKGITEGEATVELRSDGNVKRRKVVTVEAGHRINVQFR